VDRDGDYTEGIEETLLFPRFYGGGMSDIAARQPFPRLVPHDEKTISPGTRASRFVRALRVICSVNQS
jgi:hypothetical protein